MYPNKIFLGLTLYDILICLGICICFVVFSVLADKRGIKARHQKFSLICGCVGIATGLFSAALFQAIYDIPKKGKFEFLFRITSEGKIEFVNTGITFYGGVVGGAACFLLIYFLVGYLFNKKYENPRYHNEQFFPMASCAAACIAIAHSFGRVGCLMAGCCHGAKTDAWYGLSMYVGGKWDNYVPTQLFEAIFLFLLFVFLFINAYRGGKYNLPIYMASYGVWRFIIEYVRDDYRGSIGIDALTPSQLIAIIMIVGAVGVFFLERWYSARLKARYAHIRPKATIPLTHKTEGGEESAEGNENN